MATTKITSPDLFNLESLNSALKLPSGTTAQRPTSPSTGEWRYNTTTYYVEYYDGAEWRELQSENIPPINSENFNTVIWDGDGNDNRAIEVGFQPDMVWYKTRNQSNDHNLSDSTRGATKQVRPNRTLAELSATDQIKSFTSTGFTVGTGGDANSSGNTYVAWCWKANGGTTSSNTDGSITSTVQANTKAGFSIVSYTGNNSAGATVGHGLGVAPDYIILKNITRAGYGWYVQTSTGATKNMVLNNNDAQVSSTATWNDTSPTSTVFSLGSDSGPNSNTYPYIAYCFSSTTGFSKAGTYTGNGSTNGPIENTGFKPAFVMIRNTAAGYNWRLYDTARGISAGFLEANTSDTEDTTGAPSLLILSNGFQIVDSSGDVNQNGDTITYLAFGSDASAAPALADSFANKLWSGNGSSQSITGLGFSPSLVWGKERSNTSGHEWLDIVRGATNYISSSSAGAQATSAQGLKSFDSDGFSVGNDGAWNEGGQTYVAWNWKANPVPTINTDGTNQSVVSTNQAAGFSIVQGTASGGLNTVNSFGHGLGVKPGVIILKATTSTDNWYVYHTSLGAGQRIDLNDTGAASASAEIWANTEPTTSVFSIKDGQTVSVGATFIAYCFAPISGFSNFGTYAGTGGSFTVPCGFQPDYVMIRRTDSTGNWVIVDSLRDAGDDRLYANLTNAEDTGQGETFKPTGFSPRTSTTNDTNTAGGTYIYMAFKAN
mgnify:CR=1 FL=1|tara:strand:- start:916 stop:3063 length:2148 start_codon:yes stop_codon:yes gene_type:complete